MKELSHILPQDTDAMEAKLHGSKERVCWMPIESFRLLSRKFFQGDGLAKTFLSSGTTNQQPSHSLFSLKGLALYRSNALSHFHQFLHKNQAENFHGISLIPPTTQWPDSSLAQMLAWFATQWKLRYFQTENFPNNLKQPVWIFGTAAHFLDLMEQQTRILLPAKSLILETGGLKRLHASLTSSQLHKQIAEFFQIPQASVFSEYSMCELACQAYSIASKPHIRFLFAPHVRLFIQKTDPKVFWNSGTGCLVIQDPTRIDYSWAIRTQDIVRLHEDQSFELLGRVSQSPNRGCSLNVPMSTACKSQDEPMALPGFNTFSNNARATTNRSQQIIELLPKLCRSQKFIASLSTIIGSKQAAINALQDILRKFPLDAGKLFKAATTSCPQHFQPQIWLILTGSQHPCMLIEPLIFLHILGIPSYLRLSTKKVGQWQTFISSLNLDAVQIIDGKKDLEMIQTQSKATNILAFSSNQTKKNIKQISKLPLQIFSHHMTVSVVTETQLLDQTRKICRDILALNQRGCFSTKILIIQAMFCPKKWHQFSQKFFRLASLQTQEFNFEQRLALCHAQTHLQAQGYQVAPRQEDHNPVLYLLPLADAGSAFCSEFVIPVLWSSKPMASLLAPIKDLKRVASDLNPLVEGELYEQISWVALGSANINEWSGHHQNRPYFAGDCLE